MAITFLAVVACTVIGVYFIYNQPQNLGSVIVQHHKTVLQNQLATNPTQSVATSSPFQVNNSNWKTYSSNEYGFSFQYPSDWTIRSNLQEVGFGGVYLVSPTTTIEQDMSSGDFTVTVSDWSIMGTTTLETMKSQLQKNYDGYVAGQPMQVTKNFDQDNNYLKTVEFLKNNYHFQIDMNWGVSIQVFSAGSNNNLPTGFASDKKQIINIENQILSTFKFTNQTTVPSTTVSQLTHTEPQKIDVDSIYSQNGQLSYDVVANVTKLKIIRSGLQLYFQDHNSYPNSLNQLVPKYFQNTNILGSPVLDDYVTKQEFTYTFTVTNFEVCGKMETGDLICIHKN